MDKPLNTPDKLQELIEKDGVAEKDKYAAYVCKAYYSYIYDLKNHYGFQLKRILESINQALGLQGNDVIAYQAFRSSLRRIEAKRGKPSKPELKANENNAIEVRANENALKAEKPNVAETSEKPLPEAWEEILNRHPTIKAISLHKAIDSGLPIEKAQFASQEGTKQLLEVLNKYRNKTFR